MWAAVESGDIQVCEGRGSTSSSNLATASTSERHALAAVLGRHTRLFPVCAFDMAVGPARAAGCRARRLAQLRQGIESGKQPSFIGRALGRAPSAFPDIAGRP